MNEVKLQVTIKDASLCPRYSAAVIDDYKPTSGKYLTNMSVLLARSGMRSISPIVDVTNYLMLLTGQPLHAFDYDKLVKVGGQDKAHIIVRAAKPGEKMTLLDGKEVEMCDGDIVITSNDVPVALAGAMGGANTEIDADTKRIIIESATFSLYNLRGTQFRHGIFSEAITRFTKGQPPALTMPVLERCIKLLGCKAATIVDEYPKSIENPQVKLTVDDTNQLLGTDFDSKKIKTTLENVGFTVSSHGTALQVTAPYWRTDIHIKEDVIEEVGRLIGYDNIPTVLPQRDFAMPKPDVLGSLKSRIRRALSSAGANEVLTYSFVSEKLLENAGQDPKNSYKVVNSVSPELQYTRQSIAPSLLEKAYVNHDDGWSKFALFEINKLSQKKWGKTDEGVPVEKDKVAFVLLDTVDKKADFFTAKTYAEKLFRELGITARYVYIEDDNASDIPFEKKRRAKVEDAKTGVCLGIVGEFKTAVRRNFGLPSEVAGFELIIDNILSVAPANGGANYQPRSRFPEAKRDITFQTAANLPFTDLENLVRENLSSQGLYYEVTPVSIYQGNDKSTKNLSFSLKFASLSKTLSGDEIAGIMKQVEQAARKELGATIV
ncbi:MAG: phenylalanine--tRNA ligase subunit beta [Candidatus Nomurabacteria bacterium]|jgi:phenylalanyl-tRNA synthetase beta chain|nr:phenylalanine--tRNA ligase subunit beta [Candidatus Nomurabacteria bacterium]